ncbi:hypothetical protein D9M68_854890 [compost metagenome]|uniref:DUF488 family protein, N3 subclade n=1 Tax=unclassified Hydrogenophaga TaxID=2610897 RepID=UPI0006F89805|nr:hypothetical protein [Hydrogenophaga sp. Root209]KRC11940.1 hypothetical protein ASE11_00160 [Hydrogenophaga sp. Root209]
MVIRVVRLGSERVADEGTRIGTVRCPPRGVPRMGCYCEHESHCHRSVLRELLLEKGAKVEP